MAKNWKHSRSGSKKIVYNIIVKWCACAFMYECVYKLRRTTLLMENCWNSTFTTKTTIATTTDSVVVFSSYSSLFMAIEREKETLKTHAHTQESTAYLQQCKWHWCISHARERARVRSTRPTATTITKSARSQLVWFHGVGNMGWYAYTNTNTDSKWFITAIAIAVSTFYSIFSSSFGVFFSARFYIADYSRNSLVHSFLTIYVLYFFPFFNFFHHRMRRRSYSILYKSAFSFSLSVSLEVTSFDYLLAAAIIIQPLM